MDSQDNETVSDVFAALEALRDVGPALGRPLVDSIKGSALKNMKELRPASPKDSEMRILFAFGPERKAVMLLAGDKPKGKRGSLKWSGWYKTAIPQAEKIYEKHIAELGERND